MLSKSTKPSLLSKVLQFCNVCTCLVLSLVLYEYFQFPYLLRLVLILGKVWWFVNEYGYNYQFNKNSLITKIQTNLESPSFWKTQYLQYLWTSEPSKGRLHHLDALRGIASIAVVTYHVWMEADVVDFENYISNFENDKRTIKWYVKNYGHVMVPFFVVLSGFILSKIYWTPKRSKQFKTLMIGRITRIYPIHWLFASVWLAVKSYHIVHYDNNGLYSLQFEQFLPCAFLTQDWRLQFGWTQIATVCNPPAWSLSAEWLLNIGFFVCIRTFPVFWNLLIFEMTAVFGYYRFNNADKLGFSMLGSLCFPFFIGVVYDKLISNFHFKKPILQLMGDMAVIYLARHAYEILLVGDANKEFHGTTFQPSTYKQGSIFGLYLIIALDNSFIFKKIASYFKYIGEISFCTYLCHFSILFVYKILYKHEVVDLIRSDSQMGLLVVVVLGVAALAHTQFEIPMKAHLDVYFGIKKVTKTKTVDEVEYIALEEIK